MKGGPQRPPFFVRISVMADVPVALNLPLSNRVRRISASMWPGRAIGGRAVVTAFALWTLIHVFLFIASGALVALSSFQGLLVLGALAGAIGLVDLRRRRESVLLQNLGVQPMVVPAIWIASIVALEIIVSLLVI